MCLAISLALLVGLQSSSVAQPIPPNPRPSVPTTATPPAVGEDRSDPAPRPETPTDDDIPAYYFSPLKLTGRVDPNGRVAHLQADIEVHINRPTGWYDVPLRLTQAAVTAVEYEGAGEATPYQPPGVDDGVHWLFRGAGKHRLSPRPRR